VFFENELRDLGAEVIVATADGSRGVRGFVTDAAANIPHSYYFACGPEPMLKAVWKALPTSGQLSFEERMGCGFGACMGCTCKTVTGYKRICRDGPVLRKEEILWGD
jgi:dihydroorotate dehydrogenase electron transfer subunit